MTTPRDLLIVVMDAEPGRSVDRGSLSLALAGAEVVDLLGVRAVELDGDRIVPGDEPSPDDPLLREAASALIRQEPYESVEDWLWRRGRDLSSAYLAVFETEGQLTRQRRRRLISFQAGDVALVDSLARRGAVDRWAAREPVLVALATATGAYGEPLDEDSKDAPDAPDIADDAVATVLAAVNDAVMELEAVRQRRAIEDAAFDNIWRGF
ncbi:GPP34 family phosphoprotein [Streptomyces sp. NBC_00878]|uniref:GOLPH3/VPS74 family protein n=1 Tax=Streptomyces sp. NBC_00878 TaxID=2975854 RepID=UPI00225044E7|nr:GPP34 family phosphoprotein [Streptomyces sp. NBC_00878]MCX4910874.1 GPP34 family phosphoprotein [Streptomyces sp. NBC_00878]